jgi:hypothetical protein
MSDFDERDASDDEPELNEEEVLEQLQELHRQLAERQKDEEVTPSLLEPPKKLIICATRRPVRLEKPFGEASFKYETSRSGLTSAVNALQNDGVECRWVAWPGCAVEKTSQEGVRQRLEDDFNCRPVFLERDLVEAFYARFCHGVLWPLFHSLPTDVTGRTDLYEAFVQANQKYLEAVALEYQEGDVVLVHDYELMLLPAMIRGRFPDAPVGFFCHCPCGCGVPASFDAGTWSRRWRRGEPSVAPSARRCRAKRDTALTPSTRRARDVRAARLDASRARHRRDASPPAGSPRPSTTACSPRANNSCGVRWERT